MPRTALAASLLLGTAAAIACSAESPDPGSRAIVIGAAGGVASLGAVTLRVPAGALDSDVSIQIRESNESPPDDTEGLTKVYTFEPEGLTFEIPIEVRFATDDPTDGEVFWSVPESGELEPLESTRAPGLVVATTTHFSRGVAVRHRCRPSAACTLGPACTRTVLRCQPGLSESVGLECACSSDRYACTVTRQPCSGPDASVDGGAETSTEASVDAAPDGPVEAGGDASGPCTAVAPSTATTTADGRCLVTLAAGLDAPNTFTLDGSHVYWLRLSNIDGGVAKVPLAGGNVTWLEQGQQTPNGIAVDATSVYWTNFYGRTISSAPLSGVPAGGMATVLANPITAPLGIALDATHVYFTSYVGTTGAVGRVAKTGGAADTLASDQNAPMRVALDATHLYWINQAGSTGQVMTAPLAGGPATELATSAQFVGGFLALDATHVYWTVEAPNTSLGSVWKVPKAGGAKVMLAENQRQPMGIAVDDSFVYWANYALPNGTGSIAKAPIAGGAVTVLASNLLKPLEVHLDGSSLYWNDYLNVGGAIRKLTPR